jgi:hypothetical protein
MVVILLLATGILNNLMAPFIYMALSLLKIVVGI